MTDRIQVTFGVDVPTGDVDALRAKLADLHPGTIAYCNAWEELNQLYKAFLLRLDGECAAYMNIAKASTKHVFFGDQG